MEALLKWFKDSHYSFRRVNNTCIVRLGLAFSHVHPYKGVWIHFFSLTFFIGLNDYAAKVKAAKRSGTSPTMALDARAK